MSAQYLASDVSSLRYRSQYFFTNLWRYYWLSLGRTIWCGLAFVTSRVNTQFLVALINRVVWRVFFFLISIKYSCSSITEWCVTGTYIPYFGSHSACVTPFWFHQLWIVKLVERPALDPNCPKRGLYATSWIKLREFGDLGRCFFQWTTFSSVFYVWPNDPPPPPPPRPQKRKKNMASTQRSLYLLNARATCVFFFINEKLYYYFFFIRKVCEKK